VRPTLVCLLEERGVVGLFKVLGRASGEAVKMRDIERELEELEKMSKVRNNWQYNYQRSIVRLDQQYYRKMIKATSSKLQHTFDICIIQDL
jgi:hypothetical protein